MDIAWLSARQLHDAYTTRALSPVEVAVALLERIERVDRTIHAFLTVDPENVLAQARRSETALLRNEPLGPLHGIPVSIKDTIDTVGLRSTSGSLLRSARVPTDDAIAVARLRAAGAIILGKTNTPEFALSGRTVNRLAPETVNPWDPARTAGGSSGGSGAATAAGLGPMSLGTDAGGSIRYPSAFNGVFGLMASHDLIPKRGTFEADEFGSPFSSLGPLTRTVEDAALAMTVLAGYDPRDPNSSRRPVPDYLAACSQGIEGLRIGWIGAAPDTYREAGIEETIRAICDGYASLGASVGQIETRLPDPFAIQGPILRAASYELDRIARNPVENAQLTPYVAAMAATAVPTPRQEIEAWKGRRAALEWIDGLFAQADLVAAPTTCFVAPICPDGPFEMFLDYDHYITLPSLANVTGIAAASIPCGLHNGMPIALMLMAPRGREDLLIRAASAHEQAWPWIDRRPTLS